MFNTHEKYLDFLNWGGVKSHPANGSPVCTGTAECERTQHPVMQEAEDCYD